MDAERFDALVRGFASHRTRRGLLRGAFAGVAAAVGLRSGATAACPPGQYQGSGARCLCRATGRPPDAAGCPCRAGETLVDGVCLDLSSDPVNCGAPGVVCTATPGTCEGMPYCRGGICVFVPLPAGTVCRPAAGICDVEERCDGVSTACPPDAFLGPASVCRPAAGPCDVAEVCSGNSAACPPDAIAAAGTVCRPAAGPCDIAEACSGSSVACPADARVPEGQQGGCPPGQVCTGGVCQAVCLDIGEDCGGGTNACCPGSTCCGGVCRNTATDPVACGGCGIRCPVNEICDAGVCLCRREGETAVPDTCCPESSDAFSICQSGESSPFLTRADTCEQVSSCPSGYTTCNGGPGIPENTFDTCRACCPPGSTCNPLGYCIR